MRAETYPAGGPIKTSDTQTNRIWDAQPLKGRPRPEITYSPGSTAPVPRSVKGPGIRLPEADRLQLQRWVRRRTERHRTVVRSRIVLLAARGLPVSQIAAQVHVTPATVRLWCRRFEENGIGALEHDARGRGRRPGMTFPRVRAVLDAMRELPPATRVTARRVATAAGTGATTVWRVWARFGLSGASPIEEIDRAIAQSISETRGAR